MLERSVKEETETETETKTTKVSSWDIEKEARISASGLVASTNIRFSCRVDIDNKFLIR